eukprot:jgi/Chrzof1/14122/Cz08g25260.t1
MAEGLKDKVKDAAGAVKDTAKEAAEKLTGGAKQGGAAGSGGAGSVEGRDVGWDKDVPDTVTDTAKPGEIDSASGTANDEWLEQKAKQDTYQKGAQQLHEYERRL